MQTHDEPLLSVQLFGKVRLHVAAGGEVTLPPLAQRLLAELALRAGTPLRRQGLIEWLWEEEVRPLNPLPPLRTHLWQLRDSIKQTLIKTAEGQGHSSPAAVERTVSEAVAALLQAKGGAIGLMLPRAAVDALQFQDLVAQAVASQDPRSLDEAIQRRRGRELLAEYHDPRVQQLRDELYAPFRGVLRQQAEVAMGQGEFTTAERYWHCLLDLSPLDEAVLRELLKTLAALAHHNDAQDAFVVFKERLWQEEEREPDSLTREVLKDLTRIGSELRKKSLAEPGQVRLPGLKAADISAELIPKGEWERPVRIFGRSAEISNIVDLMAPSRPNKRLVVLSGPGGVGKTHLAKAATLELRKSGWYPDGVRAVELEAVDSDDLIAEAVARELQIAPYPKGGAVPAVLEHLADRRMVLVLDNCEHLTKISDFVEELLNASRHLRILVTTTRPTYVSWEREVRIEPLAPLTAEDRPRTTSECESWISRNPIVELFISRAHSSFELTPENAGAVADVCRLLDGFPLYLELAGGWLRHRTIQQLSQELVRRPGLPIGSPRIPERHRTVDAVVARSYQLLHPDERSVFRKLAVFAGGWTCEAAYAVCRRPGWTMDQFEGLLLGLVEANVAHYDQVSNRYRFLHMVRLCAQDRLQHEHEMEADHAHEQQKIWLLQLARTAHAELDGHRQKEWLVRLDTEWDNLVVALEWSSTQSDPHLLGELAANLWQFWLMRSRFKEGSYWLQRALERGSEQNPMIHSELCLGAAHLEYFRTQFSSAGKLLAEATELAEAAGNSARQAYALTVLGATLHFRQNHQEGQQRVREGLELAQQTGNQWVSALAYHFRAIEPFINDDLDAARDLLEESVELFRSFNDLYFVAHPLDALGYVLACLEQLPAARERLLQSLWCYSEVQDRRGIGWCLQGWGLVCRQQGGAEMAAVLFGAAEAICESAEVRLSDVRSKRYKSAELSIITQLGQTNFDRAKARGAAMPYDRAVQYVVNEILDDTERDIWVRGSVFSR